METKNCGAGLFSSPPPLSALVQSSVISLAFLEGDLCAFLQAQGTGIFFLPLVSLFGIKKRRWFVGLVFFFSSSLSVMSQPGSGQCTEGTFVCFTENRAGNLVLLSHCGSFKETSASLIAAHPGRRAGGGARERTRAAG